jgi:hypothetical protein
VPIGIANVNFTISGQPFVFANAIGYHDKAFGDVPVSSIVRSWNAGYAQVGVYSVVWTDAILPDGSEGVTVYVARSGTVLASKCGAHAAKVRPWGSNSAYPPTSAAVPPGGLTIEVMTSEGLFRANMTLDHVIAQFRTVFERFIGPIEGGIGKECQKGTAYFEQFALRSS